MSYDALLPALLLYNSHVRLTGQLDNIVLLPNSSYYTLSFFKVVNIIASLLLVVTIIYFSLLCVLWVCVSVLSTEYWVFIEQHVTNVRAIMTLEQWHSNDRKGKNKH